MWLTEIGWLPSRMTKTETRVWLPAVLNTAKESRRQSAAFVCLQQTRPQSPGRSSNGPRRIAPWRDCNLKALGKEKLRCLLSASQFWYADIGGIRTNARLETLPLPY